MGEKQSKRAAAAAPDERSIAEGSAELRARIAALAEQVRQLAADTRSDPAPCMRTPPGAQREAPHAGASPAPPPFPVPAPARAEELELDVIAMAERAAAEIRERAQQEAARILASRRAGAAGDVTALLAVLRRMRQATAVLSAETQRLEQTAQIL